MNYINTNIKKSQDDLYKDNPEKKEYYVDKVIKASERFGNGKNIKSKSEKKGS